MQIVCIFLASEPGQSQKKPLGAGSGGWRAKKGWDKIFVLVVFGFTYREVCIILGFKFALYVVIFMSRWCIVMFGRVLVYF